jgi:hypothetical protein
MGGSGLRVTRLRRRPIQSDWPPVEHVINGSITSSVRLGPCLGRL